MSNKVLYFRHSESSSLQMSFAKTKNALVYATFGGLVLLRLVVFLQNRSLFIDEANLARNIIQLSFSDFFGKLLYDQYAPPLFMVLEKGSVLCFGVNEWALRLFPLVAGLLAFYVFLRICKILFQTSTTLYLIGLFGLSLLLLRYSTEVKQYASDVLIALCFVYWTIRQKAPIPHLFTKLPITHQTLLQLGIIGAVLLWLSMPLVFVLVGVVAYYLINLWQNNLKRKANWKWRYSIIMPLSIALFLWGNSFLVYYATQLSASVGADLLQHHHQNYFLPFPPLSGEDFQLTGKLLVSLFRVTMGKTALSLVWGVSLFLLGIWVLLRQTTQRVNGQKLVTTSTTFLSNVNANAVLALLFLPILACLAASALHKYSLKPRLILFLYPSIWLLIGIGFQQMLTYLAQKSMVVKAMTALPIFAFVVFTLYAQKGWQYIEKPYEIEEAKPLLTYLVKENSTEKKQAVEKQTQADKTLLYVHHEAVPVFDFYNNYHQDSLLFRPKLPTVLGNWGDMISSFKSSWQQDGYQEVYILHLHSQGDMLERSLKDAEKLGETLREKIVVGGQVRLYRLE